MKIIPYEVKEGRILTVVLQDKDKQIKIPIMANYDDDLAVLTKVDWTKLKDEIVQFKHDYMDHLVGLIEKNKIEKNLLSFFYNEKGTEFSTNRIVDITKRSKSQIIVALNKLKYVMIIESIYHGKRLTYQLTLFGIEVCNKLGLDNRKTVNSNEELLEAIKWGGK